MTHRSDTHRDTPRRERRSRGHQHRQGQRQPSMSQEEQPLPQQYTASYTSSAGFTGGYTGYATPQGQNGTQDDEAQVYPQTPSTPRAHQGSVQDTQYSPNRDNTRVRIRGHRYDPEDPALRTRSFVQEGHRDRVASSRPSQSDRDIQREREDRVRGAIANFQATYGDPRSQPSQSNYGSTQYDPYLDYPDCGDGPNHGSSSYGGH